MSGITENQERKALELRKAGKTDREIAAELGFTVQTVRAIFHILGREGVDVAKPPWVAPQVREAHAAPRVEQLLARIEALEARVAALEGDEPQG